jgi:hypothetical protein
MRLKSFRAAKHGLLRKYIKSVRQRLQKLFSFHSVNCPPDRPLMVLETRTLNYHAWAPLTTYILIYSPSMILARLMLASSTLSVSDDRLVEFLTVTNRTTFITTLTRNQAGCNVNPDRSRCHRTFFFERYTSLLDDMFLDDMPPYTKHPFLEGRPGKHKILRAQKPNS